MNREDLKVPGFLAHGISVDIKGQNVKDLVLLYSCKPATAAGVFTTNSVKAAPVLLDMERIKSGRAQAVLVNSGNANAATGEEGAKAAVAMTRQAARALKIDESLVLVASTGVIGEPFPIEKVLGGIEVLTNGLNAQGIPAAAEGIMTTDRYPKIERRVCLIDGREITVCGIAKGAGMIEPNMATMLAFVLTDVAIEREALDYVFREGIGRSFNVISVDGCMSTNDTALIMANGCAGNAPLGLQSEGLPVFKETLLDVLLELAKAIVRDGEGATKVIEVKVEGARSEEEARLIAYAIARSNLVKTAFFGGDPNWGRILSAAGSVGIPLQLDSLELYFNGIPLFQNGAGVREEACARQISAVMQKDTVAVLLKLGMGNSSSIVYASDLGHDYVKLNAHYRS